MKIIFLTALLLVSPIAANAASSLVPGSDYFRDQLDAEAIHDVATDAHLGGGNTPSNLTHKRSAHGFPDEVIAPATTDGYSGVPGSRHESDLVDAKAMRSVVIGVEGVPLDRTSRAPSFVDPGSDYGRR